MAEAVHEWQPTGAIILWTFRRQNRNYFGWHLTADFAGCESLIDLLERMDSASDPTKRTIALTRPRHFPFSGIGGPFVWSDYVYAEKLKLAYSASVPAATWEARFSDGKFELSIGSDFLSYLRAGIESIRRGEGDYFIGPDGAHDTKPEDYLWFWCYIQP